MITPFLIKSVPICSSSSLHPVSSVSITHLNNNINNIGLEPVRLRHRQRPKDRLAMRILFQLRNTEKAKIYSYDYTFYYKICSDFLFLFVTS